MTDLIERPDRAAPAVAAETRRRHRGPARASWLPRPVKRQPPSPVEFIAAWAFATVGFLCLWGLLFALVLSGFQETHAQRTLYSKFREQLSLQVAPLGGAIKPGAPVAVMNIPSIKLRDQVIVEGTAAGDLMSGAGHVRTTVLPGQAGTSTLYGRSALFGGPFGDITKLRPGATITFDTGQGDGITYAVDDVRRPGDPLRPPLSGTAGRLVLVTAEGGGWRSGWAPSRLVYVDATLKGTGLPTVAGRPSRVPTAEHALKPDPDAIYQLVLWIPLLLGIALAALWATHRWGRPQTWLVGVPALLAALWGVSQTAVQLLPNLV